MVLLDNIIELFNLSQMNLGEQSAHHEEQCQLQIDCINSCFISATWSLASLNVPLQKNANFIRFVYFLRQNPSLDVIKQYIENQRKLPSEK